jgi:hypothetical protein
MRIICSSRFWSELASGRLQPWGPDAQTDLEALVLQDPFNSGVFSTGGQLGLKDYAEGAISHNLALCVGQVLVLSRLTILDLFADDFCAAVSFFLQLSRNGMENSPPILREEKADGRFWLIVWGYATRGGSAKRCADCYGQKGGR